ncbi:MAG: hypothetical protein AAB209_01550 [Bacteroidota bacterium]
MYFSTNRLKRGVQGLIGSVVRGFPVHFDYTKKELIDYTFKNVVPDARSFADLGGVWRIGGAYTFYVLDTYTIQSAALVDTNFTSTVCEKSRKYSNLVLIEDNFGSRSVAKRIEYVDAILLFDVLLHQVKPDWNEILEMYSHVTRCFVVYNQQFIASEATVRLPELGAEKYFEHVRIDRNGSAYKNLFEKPNEIHPQHNRPWRDVHNVWQWGITDKDLIDTMNRLGFILHYRKNHGQFSNFRSFENHAFIFLKTKE